MGAQQSSDRGQPSEGSAVTNSNKTCYYELLGLERQANDDEIKKAYRRKALELHPDRNLNNVAVATEKFAQVQSAYEVLSDPQERAWYDSHRDAILSGDDALADGETPPTFHNVRLTTTEEILSLMRRFTPTIPFDDEPTGFYGIARETFEQLALEEEAAAEHEDLDSPDYPTFGSSDDDYDTVVKRFYNAWTGFSTRKQFSWKDKYRLSDAPDRRVRRLMEKENKKFRDDAIREFNDAVRFLVTFVRKRDPRYMPNTQTDADRQKSMRDAAAAQAARSRAANQEKLSNYQIPEWAQSQENAAEEHYFSGDEEDSEVEVLECVVCNKIFKSDKQLEAHERSKKHTKAVQQLRWQMKKEGAELDLDPGSDVKEELAKRVDEQEISESATTQDASTRPAADEQDDSSEAELEMLQEEPSKSTYASEDEDYAPRSIVQDRILSDASGPSKTGQGGQFEIDGDLAAEAAKASIQDTSAPQRRKGKAKVKREKKAAQQQNLTADTHRCSNCNEIFESRTMLFEHIRREGHAELVPITKLGGKSSKKKR